MPSNSRVDAVFRELAPSIFDAWLKTAPDQPADECVIAIPIPEGMLRDTDGPMLEGVIEAMFLVKSAKMVKSIDPRMPVPGIRIVGQSWDHYQKISAMIRSAEAA